MKEKEMAMRKEMRSLAQEVISAYDARVRGVAQIRKATEGQLRQFHGAHQALARRQRVALAQGRSGLASSVVTQMKGLHAGHQAMARQQRADLAQGRAELAGSMATQMRGLHAGHQAMARQQRAALAQGRAELAGSMATQMRGLHAGHQAMARQQRAALAQGRTGLARAVNAWVREVAADHAGARGEWSGMAATLRAKRAGGAARATAAAPAVRPTAPAPAAAPTQEEDEEGAIATAEVGEVSAELSSLVQGVFHFLADHPDGTRLRDLERELGAGRFQMARAIRSLMDEGKVEKRDLQYFAI